MNSETELSRMRDTYKQEFENRNKHYYYYIIRFNVYLKNLPVQTSNFIVF